MWVGDQADGWVYWGARRSSKIDLKLSDGTQVELFSFPNPPPRPSYPEACGRRHLAFSVADLAVAVAHLRAHGVAVEPVRMDEYTGRRFTFFADPDGLPLELYERTIESGAARRGDGQPPPDSPS